MVLHALGSAYDDLSGVKMGPQARHHGAQKLRGYDGDDDFSVMHGGTIAGDGEILRNGKAGKEVLVLAVANDLLRGLRAVSPECDVMTAAAVKREGDGGSPCAGTYNEDATHAGCLAPNLDSVPASRRRMFW